MDALKRSIADEKAAAPAAKKPAQQGKRTAAKEEALRTQPQFKLPIAGGKKEKAAEKPAAKPAPAPAGARQAAQVGVMPNRRRHGADAEIAVIPAAWRGRLLEAPLTAAALRAHQGLACPALA